MSRDCPENKLIGELYRTNVLKQHYLTEIERQTGDPQSPSWQGYSDPNQYDLPRGSEEEPEGPMGSEGKARIPKGLEAGRRHKIRRMDGSSWDRILSTAVDHMRSRKRFEDQEEWGTTKAYPPDTEYEDFEVQITTPPGYVLGTDKGPILDQDLQYRVIKKLDAGGGHDDEVIRKVWGALPPGEGEETATVLQFQRLVMLHPENDADLNKLDDWEGDPSPHWQAWEEFARKLPDVEKHPGEAAYAKGWSKMLGDTDDASISYPRTARSREREELATPDDPGGFGGQKASDEAKWKEAESFRDDPMRRRR